MRRCYEKMLIMKKPISLFTVLAAVLIANISMAVERNLIVNGDFNTGTIAGWVEEVQDEKSNWVVVKGSVGPYDVHSTDFGYFAKNEVDFNAVTEFPYESTITQRVNLESIDLLSYEFKYNFEIIYSYRDKIRVSICFPMYCDQEDFSGMCMSPGLEFESDSQSKIYNMVWSGVEWIDPEQKCIDVKIKSQTFDANFVNSGIDKISLVFDIKEPEFLPFVVPLLLSNK